MKQRYRELALTEQESAAARSVLVGFTSSPDAALAAILAAVNASRRRCTADDACGRCFWVVGHEGPHENGIVSWY